MKLFAKAFAKVNPYLKITGLKENGYHELEVSYLSVNLADKLVLKETREGSIRVVTDAEIPLEDNLCFKVAKSLKEICGPDAGVEITLHKCIPIGGGLGGGSSDAATTLIGLNRLWNCDLTRKQLANIGSDFGADIPFFFYGGYCIGRGTGNDINQLENPYSDRLVPIITPSFSQITKEVYAKYDEITEHPASGSNYGRPNPDGGSGRKGRQVRNDLQKPAIQLNPDLENYLSVLKETTGISHFGVSGSGSSVFGVTKPGIQRKEIETEITEELDALSGNQQLEITRPTGSGQIITEGE